MQQGLVTGRKKNCNSCNKICGLWIKIIIVKGTVKEKWKGVQAETWESQELIETYKRFVVLIRSYSTNTQPIWKRQFPRRSLRNSGLHLLLLEFNNFSFLIDLTDKFIYTSWSWDQNSNQWHCSIIVKCLRLYQVTSILHCYWREFWSRDTDVYLTYMSFSIILTQFYVNFSRQEHHINGYAGFDQLLRFSGLVLYPLTPFIFPLQSL